MIVALSLMCSYESKNSESQIIEKKKKEMRKERKEGKVTKDVTYLHSRRK